MKSSTFGDLGRSRARKLLEWISRKNNSPKLAIAVMFCVGIVLGREWLLESAALLFPGLAFWRGFRHDREAQINRVTDQLPSLPEPQILQGKVGENQENRFAAMTGSDEPDVIGPIVSGIGLLMSPAVVLWQSYLWLKSGIWPDIIIGDAWRWAGIEVKSTGWLGLDKIINFVLNEPLWFGFLIVGLLIACLGIGITSLINARFYALQMRYRLDLE